MLGSLVLAVQKRKTRCWGSSILRVQKEEANGGKLGIGSLKRKNKMLGSSILRVQEEKA
jgi:hypothetical protein